MATIKSKRVIWGAAVAGAVLVAIVGAFAFSIPGLGKHEKVKESNGTVTIPVDKLANGAARFYKFADGGKEIAFFAVKAADGSIRTAFDACDACYASKKGYEQQGERMNCRNCNQKFAINRLGPNASGGCNPGHLPHQLNGGVISIKAADLRTGARYF